METTATDAAPGSHELAAFRAECEAAEATLRGAADVDPRRPGLGGWSLGELVRHLVGVAGRLDRLADRPTPRGPADVDRCSYFRTDPAGAKDEPALGLPAEWAPQFRQAWTTSVRRYEAIGPGALLASSYGAIAAVEYLATRVLEVTVHHMDVCAALDRPRVTTPAAGRLTAALLEGMLAGPRPRNLGRTRFILAATGRVAIDDPRFPVLR